MSNVVVVTLATRGTAGTVAWPSRYCVVQLTTAALYERRKRTLVHVLDVALTTTRSKGHANAESVAGERDCDADAERDAWPPRSMLDDDGDIDIEAVGVMLGAEVRLGTDVTLGTDV
jgi:hypothetical protein